MICLFWFLLFHTHKIFMWYERSTSATFQYFLKKIKFSFCWKSLGRGLIFCVPSCVPSHLASKSSVQESWSKAHQRNSSKTHLIMILCLHTTFSVISNLCSDLTFLSVVRWNHSGWQRPAYLHWDIVQGQWSNREQNTECESVRKELVVENLSVCRQCRFPPFFFRTAA